MKPVTFQTRARTIDHLGRGQIADCPTAVSELWKNAFDAYARNVELQIFEGAPAVAAVFDDGVGMNRDDFVNRWLVIGTESKIDTIKTTSKERFGLKPRQRQGEKGIGRLSAAFLAPLNLIVSKKEDSQFAALLVDWRLFENPFLALSDIVIPVEEFEKPEQIFDLFPKMIAELGDNLNGTNGPLDRKKRLIDGWKRYDEHESSEKKGDKATSERIRVSCDTATLLNHHLTEWSVFHGLVEHGTALYLLDVHRELRVWVDPTITGDDDEVRLVKDSLEQTLTGFVDPFSEDNIEFDYAIRVNRNGKHDLVLSSSAIFTRQQLRNLEHLVEGRFDDKGVFTGTVRAFGKERGNYDFRPALKLSEKWNEKVGPFSICIGTFEQNRANSTHDDESHSVLKLQAERYAGLAVYRDGLRVMPYGRPQADFFRMEERRSMHAGREFWAHRRSFGRIAFTRQENPNLRDKAGREGLIDNRSRRELQIMVENLLKETARRFFGSQSEIREDELAGIQRKNALAKEAAAKASNLREKSFKKALRHNCERITQAVDEVQSFLKQLAKDGPHFDPSRATLARERFAGIVKAREELRLPPVPAELSDEEEERYKDYGKSYRKYNDLVLTGGQQLAVMTEKVPTLNQKRVLTEYLSANEKRITEKLTEYRGAIAKAVQRLTEQWNAVISADRDKYAERAKPLLQDLETGTRLATLLNLLDVYYVELEERFDEQYGPFLRTLEQLIEGVDFDSALAITDRERATLDEKLSQFYALAQMGISIEILGHELETMDHEVSAHLKKLPDSALKHPSFKIAFEAYKALVDRLRFLAPLKLAGYRARQKITGKEITEYIERFFEIQFRNQRISFKATNAFRRFAIHDLPSRIFPVFINLVNNSLYWISRSPTREIVFDVVDDLVIVADSGPGVDPEDIGRLFDLFFTRRAQGRGVGLYLSRLNLAVAHHKIRYATKDDSKVLPGANFVIAFKGIEHE